MAGAPGDQPFRPFEGAGGEARQAAIAGRVIGALRFGAGGERRAVAVRVVEEREVGQRERKLPSRDVAVAVATLRILIGDADEGLGGGGEGETGGVELRDGRQAGRRALLQRIVAQPLPVRRVPERPGRLDQERAVEAVLLDGGRAEMVVREDGAEGRVAAARRPLRGIERVAPAEPGLGQAVA